MRLCTKTKSAPFVPQLAVLALALCMMTPVQAAGRDALFGLDEDSPKAAAKEKSPAKPAGGRDALFGLDEDSPKAAKEDSPVKPAGGRDALFGLDDDKSAGKSAAKPAAEGGGIRGFLQFELARATESPKHWTKMLTRADLSSQGNLGGGIKWKLGARVDYDAAYDYKDYYPGKVERDQRFNVSLRENYIDIAAGDWDYRLGKQHVVWGEMVGMFFADVVSARDMHEFILPEFDTMRIPQWAARAEYFKDDFHAEFLWVPVASYDRIGKPGAEF